MPSDEKVIDFEKVPRPAEQKKVLPPFPNITAKNYSELAEQRIQEQGGRGFMIAPQTILTFTGHEVHGCPMQWGAWWKWRKRKGLPLNFMRNKLYYMVPAEWPFQFDAETSEAESREDGRVFFDWMVEKQKKEAVGRERLKNRNLNLKLAPRSL